MSSKEFVALAFGIALIATLIYVLKKYSRQSIDDVSKTSKDEEQQERAKQAFQESLEELEKNARGYSLYKALLKTPLRLDTEKTLYEEYGKSLVEPSMVSLSAAEKYRDTFYGTTFQALVKSYLEQHNVVPGFSGYTMLNQMGDVAMKMYADKMEEIVQRKKVEEETMQKV